MIDKDRIKFIDLNEDTYVSAEYWVFGEKDELTVEFLKTLALEFMDVLKEMLPMYEVWKCEIRGNFFSCPLKYIDRKKKEDILDESIKQWKEFCEKIRTQKMEEHIREKEQKIQQLNYKVAKLSGEIQWWGKALEILSKK